MIVTYRYFRLKKYQNNCLKVKKSSNYEMAMMR